MEGAARGRPRRPSVSTAVGAPSIMVLPHGSELKMRILHSIDRPLDEMTVAEICARTGISRRTFYNHFKSKRAILPWFAGLARLAFTERIGRDISLADGLLMTYEFIHGERDFIIFAAEYDYLIDGPHDPEWDKWYEAYVETIRRYHHVRVDEELEVLLFGFVSLEAALVKRWVRDKLEPSPADFVARLMEFAPARLRRLLDPVS